MQSFDKQEAFDTLFSEQHELVIEDDDVRDKKPSKSELKKQKKRKKKQHMNIRNIKQ